MAHRRTDAADRAQTQRQRGESKRREERKKRLDRAQALAAEQRRQGDLRALAQALRQTGVLQQREVTELELEALQQAGSRRMPSYEEKQDGAGGADGASATNDNHMPSAQLVQHLDKLGFQCATVAELERELTTMRSQLQAHRRQAGLCPFCHQHHVGLTSAQP